MIGQRIDKVLASLCSDFSRSAIQNWIKQGLVLLDDESPRQKDKVLGGESVEIEIPEIRQGEWEPQEIDFEIVYEDEAMLVINKPSRTGCTSWCGQSRRDIVKWFVISLT